MSPDPLLTGIECGSLVPRLLVPAHREPGYEAKGVGTRLGITQYKLLTTAHKGLVVTLIN